MKRTVIAVTSVQNPGKILFDVLQAASEHVVPDRWLRHGFWKESEQYGEWFVGKYFRSPARSVSAEEAEEEVDHRLGAIYVFYGTFDEFLRKFSTIPVDGTVKRCPKCRDCFVSPPAEFLKHVTNCSGLPKSDRDASCTWPVSSGWHDDCCTCCC